MAIQLCSAFRRQITGTPAFYQTQVEQNINAAAGLAALGAQASCLLSSLQRSCKKPAGCLRPQVRVRPGANPSLITEALDVNAIFI